MRLKTFTSTVILIFLIVSICSCQEKKFNENNIIGKWEVTDFIDNTKNINLEIIEDGKKLALSTTYIFKKDKTYFQKSSLENVNGTWSYDSISKSIKMTFSSKYEKNDIEKYEISNFNNEEMSWKSDFGEFGSTNIILSKK